MTIRNYISSTLLTLSIVSFFITFFLGSSCAYKPYEIYTLAALIVTVLFISLTTIINKV